MVGRRKQTSACKLCISTVLDEWVKNAKNAGAKRDSIVGEKRRDAMTQIAHCKSARHAGCKNVLVLPMKYTFGICFYLTPFSCSPCRADTRVASRNGFRFGYRITFICSSAAQHSPPSETISTGDSTLKQGERFGRLLQM